MLFTSLFDMEALITQLNGCLLDCLIKLVHFLIYQQYQFSVRMITFKATYLE